MPDDNDPLILRLLAHGALDAAERAGLDALLDDRVEAAAGEVLEAAGTERRHAWIVLRGWCLRSRLSEDGGRQVVNFLLPGETCGLFAIVFRRAEHEFSALTDAVLARVPTPRLSSLFASSPRMAWLLTWLAAHDERLLEEQIVRLGLKESPHRLAHLLCELQARATVAGLDNGEALQLPLTQAVLGETLGLSRVHVNRVFRELAEAGVVDTGEDGGIAITDLARLRRIARFDDHHLVPGADGNRRPSPVATPPAARPGTQKPPAA